MLPTAARNKVLSTGFSRSKNATVMRRCLYNSGTSKSTSATNNVRLRAATPLHAVLYRGGQSGGAAVTRSTISKRSFVAGATTSQDKDSSFVVFPAIALACGILGVSLLAQPASYNNTTVSSKAKAEAASAPSLNIPRNTNSCVGSHCINDTDDGALALSVKKDGSKGDEPIDDDDDNDEATTLLNWSGTHEIHLKSGQYYEPETVEEVEQLVKQFYKTNTPFRPVGSALSPNAIGFHYTARRHKQKQGHHQNTGAMINLVHLDKIIRVDRDNMTVTVQAGARVSQVIDALRPYGLTLPNLASIAEQQIGGFLQVGAHGTGARIPPVDEFCTSLTMVTPFMGTVTLEANKNRRSKGKKQCEGNQKLQQHYSEIFVNAPSLDPLFQISKVGLGSLGIVTEVTLQCIPAHNLVEHTYVITRQQAKDQIQHLLKQHKHIRYMWIPYADAVVVVTNDPEDSVDRTVLTEALDSVNTKKKTSKEILHREQQAKLKPFSNLLLVVSDTFQTKKDLEGMGFDVLRDQCLIAKDPLDVEHVKKCNQAEAEFWRNSEGYQIKPSDQLLQFECGGQQWVKEMCFPTGTYVNNNGNDMAFMEALLKGIEREGIPAHTPIEQRWSCGSSSFMSPAYEPNNPQEALFSWVGIIMYLPNAEDKKQRTDITNLFKGKYCHLMEQIGYKVNAATHWAKLELPTSDIEIQTLQRHMKQRFPVYYFNHARYTFDPTNLMSNDLINASFGDPADSDTMGNIANKPKL